MKTTTDKKPHLSSLAMNEVKEITAEIGKIRIIDFILGILLTMIGFTLPGGIPVSVAATAVLVFLALNRKSKVDNPMAAVIVLFLLLCIAYAGINSFLFGSISTTETLQRVVKLIGVVMLALVIADGRVDFRSMIFGMIAFLLANVPVFYAGLNSNTYGGYLTGWIADKNQSGLWYAAIGFVAIILLRKRTHQVIAMLLFLTLIFLTGSRTSTAAFIFAVLWLVFAHRLNLFFKIFFAIFIVWAVDWLTVNFSQNSVFGDRTGTDALRERIDEASLAKLEAAPWHGLGYGQATVKVEENTFFFHNSFWTLIVEGGYLYMLAVIALILIAVLVLKQPQMKRGEPKKIAGEAMMVLLFICSWRLGEVLLTVPWAIALGLALSYLSVPKADKEHKWVGSQSV